MVAADCDAEIESLFDEMYELTLTPREETRTRTVTVTNEETGEVTTLESYDVDASWSYAPGTSMDVANIQSHALFQVVDHNGRMEIAAINYQEEPVQEENYGY